MSGDHILALDQGTTSSRAIVFDRAGTIVAQAGKEFPQRYPQPGWVEHDPEEIWSSQLDTARAAIEQSGLVPDQIAAIGLTNQRETTIVWDRKTGAPLYNAIVWQCRRTAPMCDRIKAEGFDQVIQAKTGLVVDAYFSGTKLAWLLDNISGARERAERGQLAFGTVDTFLLWRLSNGRLHITDPSNASRTMMYNIHDRSWDVEILEYFDIPASILPEVHPSSAVYGETDPDLFGASIPLAGIAGDQQAAMFGQACFKTGLAKNTYGTGCFLLLNTGEKIVASQNGLLTTIGWSLNTQDGVTYCLEGSVFIAGAAVQWLRDGMGMISQSNEVEALASSVPDNGGVYLVPAFVGLGAPYWDPYARGTLLGLTRGTTNGHIARAALEAIAYQSRDVIEAMRKDSRVDLQALRVDGGASRNDLLMQFQADILGVPVQRPVVTETTALGAAFLGGLAIGLWPTDQSLADLWQLNKEFIPSMSEDQRESLYAMWQRAVERSRSWIETQD
jgi:glycerol kinase